MGFARYFSKVRRVLSILGIVLIYIFFRMIFSGSDAPMYQNPFILILIHLGYYSILFPFDYSNTMMVYRQEYLEKYYRKALGQIIRIGIGYMVPLHVLIYIAGYLLRDWMDWQKMGVALLYNSCNAVLFGSVYLVASNRWNTLVAKVGLYSILPFCYGINFGGEFFEAVNFLYFAREAMFHTGLFLRSIGCYGVLFALIYALRKKKERT